MWGQHDKDSAFKELPYYRNIVKSFFKKQIQYLLEEMCKEAGEESVIMTVNLHNGTMSHLGSKVGKAFLDDREDLKTQFLSYCISIRHIFLIMAGKLSWYPFRIKVMASKLACQCQCKDDMTGKVLAGKKSNYTANNETDYSLGGVGFQEKQKDKSNRQNKRKQTESPDRKDQSLETLMQKKIRSSITPVIVEAAKSTETPIGEKDDALSKNEVKTSGNSAESQAVGIGNEPFKQKSGFNRAVSETVSETEYNTNHEYDNNHDKDKIHVSKRPGILKSRRTKNNDQSIDQSVDQFRSVQDSGDTVMPDETSISEEYPERCKEKKVIVEELSGNTIKIEPLSDDDETDIEQSTVTGTKYLSTEGVVSVSRIGTVLRHAKQLASSKTRTVLTFGEKFQILQDMEANPELSFRQLAKRHNVGRTTIGQIAKNRTFYRTQYGVYAESTRKKCTPITKYNSINDLVWRWYSDARDNGLLVSGSMVREKALNIAKELSENNFKASNGWLSSWQSRYNVKSFKVTGESRKKAIAIPDWSDYVGLASESANKEIEDKTGNQTNEQMINDDNENDGGDSVWSNLLS